MRVNSNLPPCVAVLLRCDQIYKHVSHIGVNSNLPPYTSQVFCYIYNYYHNRTIIPPSLVIYNPKHAVSIDIPYQTLCTQTD